MVQLGVFNLKGISEPIHISPKLSELKPNMGLCLTKLSLDFCAMWYDKITKIRLPCWIIINMCGTSFLHLWRWSLLPLSYAAIAPCPHPPPIPSCLCVNIAEDMPKCMYLSLIYYLQWVAEVTWPFLALCLISLVKFSTWLSCLQLSQLFGLVPAGNTCNTTPAKCRHMIHFARLITCLWTHLQIEAALYYWYCKYCKPCLKGCYPCWQYKICIMTSTQVLSITKTLTMTNLP